MELLSNVLIWAFGWFVGIAMMVLVYKNGTLNIDHSDPAKDKYLIVIDNLEDLTKRKFVLLEIKNNADLSQK